MKEDQLLIPCHDCVNLELVSRSESIEHANVKLSQAISEFSSTENAKNISLIFTHNNVVIEHKTELLPINAEAISA